MSEWLTDSYCCNWCILNSLERDPFNLFYLFQPAKATKYISNHFHKQNEIKIAFFTSNNSVKRGVETLTSNALTSLSISETKTTKLSGKTPALPLISPLHHPGSPVSYNSRDLDSIRINAIITWLMGAPHWNTLHLQWNNVFTPLLCSYIDTLQVGLVSSLVYSL